MSDSIACGEDLGSTPPEDDIVLLHPVRKPMTPSQREIIVEALAALLIDYWAHARQSSVSHPRSIVRPAESSQEANR